MDDFPRFTGNCPGNVAKDAKYAIRSGPSGPVVALTYRAPQEERWHVTTEAHPELVTMVNAVKKAKGDTALGPFYINEYRQVVVPVGKAAEYYLAGEYQGDLVFDFEGKRLSGAAQEFDGRRLSPGDEWTGPHPGIPYVLAAGGRDVYYRVDVRPNVTKDVKLSDQIGADAAGAFARRIRDIKGFAGGRLYVNEWREMFAPLGGGAGVKYVYLGPLPPADQWYGKPHAG